MEHQETESKRFCLFLFPSALISKKFTHKALQYPLFKLCHHHFSKYTGEARPTCWSYMTLGSVFNTTSHLFAVFTFTHIFKLISLNWRFQCEHLGIFHLVSTLGMLHKVQQRQNNRWIFITLFYSKYFRIFNHIEDDSDKHSSTKFFN